MKPAVNPLPRPKREARNVGVRMPMSLFKRVLGVRRVDETLSQVVRRLCEERLNDVNESGVPQQK